MASKQKCRLCGSLDAHVETPADFTYHHSGLTGVHLFGKGVEIIDCPVCHSKTTTVLHEAQLLQVLGMAIVLAGPGLTGEQLKYVRKLFGMTQDELARAVGKKRRETVAEWEAAGRLRLFETPFDELGLRVLLMALFVSKVIESEYCCLSPRHKSEFAQAAATFVERARGMVGGREVTKPISIRRHARTDDWSCCLPG
jgi:DNA-binding XRE family transcriptional regulator